tara:strand:- start:161 stop:1108 length:948 start_codon:yes stop_codon:yes gene_type:complete
MDKKLLIFIFGLFIIYFLCRKNVMKGGDEHEEKKNLLNNIDELSITDLENVIQEKKIQKELEDMPKIHSEFSNYQLFLDNKKSKSMYNRIKNGTYWADEAFKLKTLESDYNSVMEKDLSERENTFFSIKKAYDIKNNITEQNIIENEPMENEPMVNETMLNETMLNEPMVNEPMLNEPMENETMVNEPMVNEPMENEPMENEPMAEETMIEKSEKNSRVVCPGKSDREYCEGMSDCWKTNFCECPEAQNLCKKNMINKIYNIYDINEEEDRQRVLGIFHGSKNLLHSINEDKVEDKVVEDKIEDKKSRKIKKEIK